ncbi:MAG: NfeD family protein [Acinetobacter sp.]
MNFIVEPWHWFVIGIVLMLSELLLPAFAALWFGIAAIMVSLLFWLMPWMSFPIQIVTWVILSILCTVLWFKLIKPLSIDKTKAGQPREATIGQIGIVIETGLNHGQIKVRFPIPVLGADEWLCRCTTSVQVGDRVSVIEILGNDLLVQPYSTQHTAEIGK